MRKISSLSTLVYLNIEGPQVTDKIISTISGHHYLTSLTIRNTTSISETGLLLLKDCSSLKYLALANVPVAQNAIIQLQERLPDCEIDIYE